MAVRDRPLSHAHLNALAELLHQHPPAHALERFSAQLSRQQADSVSTNAIRFVTRAVSGSRPKEELLSRAHHAKRQIDTCLQHLAETALQKLRNRTVVVHPLGALTAPLVKNAGCIRFLRSGKTISRAPVRFEVYEPIAVVKALKGADAVLLEPRAITPEGIVVQQGGRALAELASTRRIPVYVAATSWHSVPDWQKGIDDEFVPARFLTGIISEHGIYAHDQFLARVQKTFPWIF